MARRRRLSAHFEAAEFDCNDGTRWPSWARRDLEDLCARYLEPLRREFGRVWVNSGYRTVAYNRRVGGAPRSWHVFTLHRGEGVACDVHCERGTPAEWHALLERLQPGGLGRYPWGVHVDNRPGIARW